ncbi:hypothetical protein E5288_WYG010969 [Bos mutus]|uniref:MIP18 family-like domain-containing protein n=1 Tax=Bos mutus TaxID=72004 RepID=A0A6B0QYF3_9CETA|nr:hypothetical protein [Bos mutus]
MPTAAGTRRNPGLSERGAARQPRIMEEKALEVYDLIRTIRDPEKPNTLEELEVVTESCVEVQEINEDDYLVIIRTAVLSATAGQRALQERSNNKKFAPSTELE